VLAFELGGEFVQSLLQLGDTGSLGSFLDTGRGRRPGEAILLEAEASAIGRGRGQKEASMSVALAGCLALTHLSHLEPPSARGIQRAFALAQVVQALGPF